VIRRYARAWWPVTRARTPGRAFDAAAAELALRSVADLPRTPSEIRRVLRRGSDSVLRARALDQPSVRRDAVLADAAVVASSGYYLNRDAAAIRAAGFQVKQLERFSYAPFRFVPPHAHVIGLARTPSLTQSQPVVAARFARARARMPFWVRPNFDPQPRAPARLGGGVL
jgi:hypothetical protein